MLGLPNLLNFSKDKIMYKLLSYPSFILMLILFSCSKSNEAALLDTVQGGGSNNCTTANIKFSADIAPILQANCNSCHNSTTRAEAGVKTDTYGGVKLIADNGLLIGTITHASGFSPMPHGKPKLAACAIDKIKVWIAQGAQNN